MRFAGVALPSLETIGFASVGLLAPPAIEGFLTPMLPAAVTGSTIGRYAIRIGSVVALSFAAKAIAGRDAAKTVAVAGSAYVVGTAVQEFLPDLLPGSGAVSGLGGPRLGLARRRLGAFTDRVMPFDSGPRAISSSRLSSRLS